MPNINQRLPAVYADEMRDYGYGEALYQPCTSDILKPGSVGYFDYEGNWQAIVQLRELQPSSSDSAEGSIASEFTRLGEDLQKAPDEDMVWGPKLSTNVSRVSVDLTALGTVPGIPVSAGAVWKYNSSTDFGAILMTTPPVTREMINHEDPYERWCQKNAKTILKLRPEVKDHGMWIVTKTHSTKYCSLNVWKSKQKDVHVGFSAKVAEGGDLKASGGWFENSSDGGWNHYKSKGDDRIVTFVAGLYYKFTWLHSLRRLPRTANVPDPTIAHEVARIPVDPVNAIGAGYVVAGQRMGLSDGTRTDDMDRIIERNDEMKTVDQE